MLLRHSVSPFHNGSVYTISSILWLSRSLKAPLSSHSDVCHISCTTLIRHRLILIYMLASAFSATLQLYLRSAQLDTADFHYRRLGDTALCCHPGRASVAHTFHLSRYSFGQSSNVVCIVCHFTCLLLYRMWTYLSTCQICYSVCGFFVYALLYSVFCYY